MAEKQTKLSIVLRTIDKATAPIQALNARLDAINKPARDFASALSGLREKSGLNGVVDGFKGVGSALSDVLSKVAIVGAVVGGATAALFHMVDGFDALGDKAEAIGVGVDFLAQMRHAAEMSGASVQALDAGMQGFSKSLGQARAGAGRMAGFLERVSPALLKQLKGAKSNEQALDLLADAMRKLEDPAKRAALAQATLGDAALAPLFARGAAGIAQLREEHFKTAGSMEEAAKAAGETDDALKNLKAATDGVKAALVSGLAPALKVIVERLKGWLVEHREDIKEWAATLGERIPAAVDYLKGKITAIVAEIRPFVNEGWKIKAMALAVAAAIAGPLVASIAKLGLVLLTNPIGLIITGIALAAALIVEHWTPIKAFFVGLWDGIKDVFARAWKFIKGIVDKVVGAVDWVLEKAGALGKAIGGDIMGGVRSLAGPEGASLIPQSRSALDAVAARASEARVTVDFANAPRGTRVTADPQSTANIDLGVGYQMLLGTN